MATTVSASFSPAIPSKRHVPPTRILLALDGSGNASETITFSPAFDNAPLAHVTPPLGVTGTFSVGSITTSGATITVTGASLTSQNCEVVLYAHEKL